ncbi:hypothetical protein GYA93_23310 [Gordonia desulfuricans]|uniref:Uncharacterized protein n=1 Tax=Gordonia desulfuricans TaxID=89051 RepID=A0A7K3LW26_9ACTN|nr:MULTISPECIES: hypothetical protein [Gordonia]NDK92462.1 hypothetical protein [Gordonia desulfuricans]WLP92651.1 hypothetical protein Q9K23_10700 [Gordonia sp. NB41Y]
MQSDTAPGSSPTVDDTPSTFGATTAALFTLACVVAVLMLAIVLISAPAG